MTQNGGKLRAETFTKDTSVFLGLFGHSCTQNVNGLWHRSLVTITGTVLTQMDFLSWLRSMTWSLLAFLLLIALCPLWWRWKEFWLVKVWSLSPEWLTHMGCCRLLCSRMWCHVVWGTVNSISGETVVSIFRLEEEVWEWLYTYQIAIRRSVVFRSRGLLNKSRTEYTRSASSSFWSIWQLSCNSRNVL